MIGTLIQPHTCEMGSCSFSAMSLLKVPITTRASFTSMPSTERKNGGKKYVDHGSACRAYPYFLSPCKPGACPSAQTCRNQRHHPQIWCWWWRQSGFPISLGLEHHLFSPSLPSWCTTSSDLLQPWWISGSLRTQLEGKARRARYRSMRRTLLCRARTIDGINPFSITKK